MTDLKHAMGRKAFSTAFEVAYYKIGKDRQKAILDMFKMAEKYLDETDVHINYDKAEAMIMDENNGLNRYINRFVDNIDKHVLKTAFLNFGYEAMFRGTKIMEDARITYNCNVPWLILMDPTSACNLHCTGCWAAEYGNKMNLSLDEMDKVIREGKELGIYLYMYTGGEPLVRKKDLIRLCDMHPDVAFMTFTNGTLIDEDFVQELKRVGNLYPVLSLEGFEDSNDERRGQGVFDKVMHAMDLMKENGCLFGTSVCYTRNNIETVTSEEFVKMEIEKGVMFSMYFHLMPVGMDASPDLMPTIDQRVYMYHRMREIRNMAGDGHGLFCFDFQNDGEFVNGCIAGGKNYFHINANGDAEPCVFIHYSNANIRDNSLLDILHSPIFMKYHENQPFNDNKLRPCPMLENPEILPRLVKESGAKSTDLQAPESAEHLCAKCQKYAEMWKPVADRIWEESGQAEKLRQKKAAEEAGSRNIAESTGTNGGYRLEEKK
ncbi:MAG: radical SAM protein [Anaerovoracaceae bacterium]|jgi:MoaA/NifB/PqqE/SkfB family radical SAM enzyme